jgi:uncharacterized surface protein with fasciclin (FAS1) repeats
MHKKLASTAIALAFGSFALVGTAQATGYKFKQYWQCVKTPLSEYPGTIAEAACDPSLDSVLGTLCDAVGLANPAIGEALSDPKARLTVFAPTNEAFGAVPFLGKLLKPQNQGLLDNVLLYHVVSGKHVDPRRSAVIRKVPTLLEGQNVFFSYDFGKHGGPMINQSSTGCEGVKTENGTVWIIDSVLQPQYF